MSGLLMSAKAFLYNVLLFTFSVGIISHKFFILSNFDRENYYQSIE